ncbi:MAG: Xaa-Pro peptidase family protein [Candidatus Peribacteraceae bacterium]|nr:Xaa-Pro peptidase family protein [Candidatus Peribacteraceae bacterium]
MHPASPRALLRHASAPAFLVTDLTNIRYLTGVELSSGALLVTPSALTLFVDGRYREAAEQHRRRGVVVRSIDRFPVALARAHLCAFEAEGVSVARLKMWKRKYKNTKFVHSQGVVQEFRRAKDPGEVRAFQEAQRITSQLLKRIPSILRPGLTERELAWKLQTWAHALAADHLAFDPIVAFGAHASHPHHHPTPRSLRKGDLVQIDVGARFSGYCADQSAVFFTAEPTELQARVLAAVREAKEAAERAVCVGASTHELDRIARSVLKRHGWEKYFPHSLGHGVGLEIHEGVTLSTKRPEEKLLRNEIITIEPGVYLPGKFGIRLEEEIVVGE